MKRSMIILMVLVVLVVLALAPAATAHVHGITPLLCDGIGNANSGANAAQGGPIAGLIPRVVGNADLVPFVDGAYKHAVTRNPHCVD